jgi:hypothetical protein
MTSASSKAKRYLRTQAHMTRVQNGIALLASMDTKHILPRSNMDVPNTVVGTCPEWKVCFASHEVWIVNEALWFEVSRIWKQLRVMMKTIDVDMHASASWDLVAPQLCVLYCFPKCDWCHWIQAQRLPEARLHNKTHCVPRDAGAQTTRVPCTAELLQIQCQGWQLAKTTLSKQHVTAVVASITPWCTAIGT